MVNLENWAWAECHLGNIAKRAQQFNLLGVKRKSERKKGEDKRGEGRENRKGWKRGLKKEKEKIEKQR